MVPRIVDMRYTSRYRLWLKFKDGTEGEVDLEGDLWGEVFEPLKDERYFQTARLNRELNTVYWDTGADLAPEYLYEKVRLSLSGRSKAVQG